MLFHHFMQSIDLEYRMSPPLKIVLEILALSTALASLSQWPFGVIALEPDGWMLSLCGMVIGFFIVRQRLSLFRASL
jgi:hypothetical protein